MMQAYNRRYLNVCLYVCLYLCLYLCMSMYVYVCVHTSMTSITGLRRRWTSRPVDSSLSQRPKWVFLGHEIPWSWVNISVDYRWFCCVFAVGFLDFSFVVCWYVQVLGSEIHVQADLRNVIGTALCEASAGAYEQWLLNPCWLMISSGIVLPFIYWGW